MSRLGAAAIAAMPANPASPHVRRATLPAPDGANATTSPSAPAAASKSARLIAEMDSITPS